jgi:hypothetical protein
MLTTALALGIAAAGCTTAATADSSTGGSSGQAMSTGGSTGSPGTGGSIVGSGGSTVPGSGGLIGSTGSGGTETGQSGGAVGLGGSVGSGGSPAGGSVGSGGASPTGTGGKIAMATGGSTGAGGSSAASGCNWITKPDGTWAFAEPAAAAKIMLFDGTTLTGWHKQQMPGVAIDWMLLPDGTMKVVPNATNQAVEVQSDMKFEDLCVHVEYLTPMWTSMYNANVQRHGNSGVYLKSAYEMQILDTHDMAPLNDGCGAAYKVQAPLVVACNMYGIWNTYEIEFKSSGWTGTTKTKNATFARVALNGKIVQMNTDLPLLVTQAGLMDAPGPQPLGLQDHLDTVSFRNIWVTVPHY